MITVCYDIRRKNGGLRVDNDVSQNRQNLPMFGSYLHTGVSRCNCRTRVLNPLPGLQQGNLVTAVPGQNPKRGID
jgi:hypothetical protein